MSETKSHPEKSHPEKSHSKILRMANQIAMFFASKPEDIAVAGIVDHINKFWEKRMRAEFFTLLEAGADFHPLVQIAAKDIKRPS